MAGMWILLLPLLAHVPSERAILEAENAREAGMTIPRAAIASSDAESLPPARTLNRHVRSTVDPAGTRTVA